jgi:hypothetical protein
LVRAGQEADNHDDMPLDADFACIPVNRD